VLSAAGLGPRALAWIPLVKLPMRPQAKPSEDLIRLDRDDTWKQIRILMPKTVWIQGISTTEKWIGTQVREQITERVVVQNINERRTRAEGTEIINSVARKLQQYLTQ
jgi:hypothetical protein